MRSLLPAGLTTLAMLAVLIGLGVWQLERLGWKRDLLRQIDQRAHGTASAPLPEPQWPGWRAEADEFRRVRLQGRFDPGATIAVHGLAEVRRGNALQGFYLFQPLEQADGSTIFVNRGFVPTELRRDAETRLASEREPVVVTGLVRAPQTRGAFVPANDPSRGEWFVRDPGEMARVAGLSRVAPFYVDADLEAMPGGWPRGGQTELTLPNNHLQYAITWFALAGALVAVFAVFVRKRLVESRSELEAGNAGHDQTDAGEPEAV